jgi:hypothetical protein
MDPVWGSLNELRGRVNGVFSELFSMNRNDQPSDQQHQHTGNSATGLQSASILEKTTRMMENAFDLNEGGATLSAHFVDWVALLAETKTREVC